MLGIDRAQLAPAQGLEGQFDDRLDRPPLRDVRCDAEQHGLRRAGGGRLGLVGDRGRGDGLWHRPPPTRPPRARSPRTRRSAWSAARRTTVVAGPTAASVSALSVAAQALPGAGSRIRQLSGRASAARASQPWSAASIRPAPARTPATSASQSCASSGVWLANPSPAASPACAVVTVVGLKGEQRHGRLPGTQQTSQVRDERVGVGIAGRSRCGESSSQLRAGGAQCCRQVARLRVGRRVAARLRRPSRRSERRASVPRRSARRRSSPPPPHRSMRCGRRRLARRGRRCPARRPGVAGVAAASRSGWRSARPARTSRRSAATVSSSARETVAGVPGRVAVVDQARPGGQCEQQPGAEHLRLVEHDVQRTDLRRRRGRRRRLSVPRDVGDPQPDPVEGGQDAGQPRGAGRIGLSARGFRPPAGQRRGGRPAAARRPGR